MGLFSGRANRDLAWSEMALPENKPQLTDFKGPRPLMEVQEAKPPGGSEGGALAFLIQAIPPPRSTPPACPGDAVRSNLRFVRLTRSAVAGRRQKSSMSRESKM